MEKKNNIRKKITGVEVGAVGVVTLQVLSCRGEDGLPFPCAGFA